MQCLTLVKLFQLPYSMSIKLLKHGWERWILSPAIHHLTFTKSWSNTPISTYIWLSKVTTYHCYWSQCIDDIRLVFVTLHVKKPIADRVLWMLCRHHHGSLVALSSTVKFPNTKWQLELLRCKIRRVRSNKHMTQLADCRFISPLFNEQLLGFFLSNEKHTMAEKIKMIK